ncbi:hypothetical protein E2562_023345 [Oryza meyeriana var. granulata]|uniref:Uncharacterized protein n=1 Tax=Oryza meyeriana var. granulata TaxID=110450 RepID=A0A6G1E2U7_9ORYZ|nr:hypothetical protein E2562_023345 [Oryza meyeriana var. granulata]
MATPAASTLATHLMALYLVTGGEYAPHILRKNSCEILVANASKGIRDPSGQLVPGKVQHAESFYVLERLRLPMSEGRFPDILRSARPSI